ncbi:MAG: hypothetical protein ACPGRD_02075 [Planktomarina sp.]
MAKRYSTRGLARDRVYDIPTAARIIGVTVGTFRKYPSRGLRLASSRRPVLIRGADLIKFLNGQAIAKRQPGRPDQFYCMRCKGQQDALGAMADYLPINSKTGRLVAFCAGCERTVSKFSSPQKAGELVALLDIAFSDSA